MVFLVKQFDFRNPLGTPPLVAVLPLCSNLRALLLPHRCSQAQGQSGRPRSPGQRVRSAASTPPLLGYSRTQT